MNMHRKHYDDCASATVPRVILLRQVVNRSLFFSRLMIISSFIFMATSLWVLFVLPLSQGTFVAISGMGVVSSVLAAYGLVLHMNSTEIIVLTASDITFRSQNLPWRMVAFTRSQIRSVNTFHQLGRTAEDDGDTSDGNLVVTLNCSARGGPGWVALDPTGAAIAGRGCLAIPCCA